MDNLFQGIIVVFREGLEAFLILILIIKFLDKTGNKHLNISVLTGFSLSVVFSMFLGFSLFILGNQIKKMDEIGKIWESVASLIAVGLMTSFIFWMIQHDNKIKRYVEKKTSLNLTKLGVFFVSFILISREGVEIAIFSFAGKYPYISILIGVIVSMILAAAIYLSLFKIKISAIFKITLIYLIIQAGYLLGYGVHEGLSALKSLSLINSENILLIKLFDLSKTILNHKEGIIGLPLNILFGWYSSPELIQFIVQYTFSIAVFFYWIKKITPKQFKDKIQSAKFSNTQ